MTTLNTYAVTYQVDTFETKKSMSSTERTPLKSTMTNSKQVQMLKL